MILSDCSSGTARKLMDHLNDIISVDVFPLLTLTERILIYYSCEILTIKLSNIVPWIADSMTL